MAVSASLAAPLAVPALVVGSVGSSTADLGTHVAFVTGWPSSSDAALSVEALELAVIVVAVAPSFVAVAAGSSTIVNCSLAASAVAG